MNSKKTRYGGDLNPWLVLAVVITAFVVGGIVENL